MRRDQLSGSALDATIPAFARAIDTSQPSADVTTRLLTADQLAARWQVPKSQVYRLAREGRVPVVTIGRYYRFRVDAIEAWERQPDG
jgi:excisionase family DNA binding protein